MDISAALIGLLQQFPGTASIVAILPVAIALASDAGRLAQLKEKLQRNRLSTALFNTPLFVEHLEAAYTLMVERHEAGLPTAPIRV